MKQRFGKVTRKNSIITGILGILLLLAADQGTKLLAVSRLKDQPAVPLIQGVLEFRYLENFGAAFGILQNQQWLFILLCAVFLLAAGYFYLRLPLKKHYGLFRLMILLLAAGAVGNLIDRVFRGYVVDFIYFSLIDFPIFNFADCCVVIGGILMLLDVLVIYRNEDYEFLKWKK